MVIFFWFINGRGRKIDWNFRWWGGKKERKKWEISQCVLVSLPGSFSCIMILTYTRDDIMMMTFECETLSSHPPNFFSFQISLWFINCEMFSISNFGCLLSVQFQADSTGQDVLNVVYQHLGSTLLETAYFGLRFVDASHQPVRFRTRESKIPIALSIIK